MSLVYHGANNHMNLGMNGGFQLSQGTIYMSQPVLAQEQAVNSHFHIINHNSTKPPLQKARENKENTKSNNNHNSSCAGSKKKNISPKSMSGKKHAWAPGKPMSPKAQEMIKSGKGRPSDVPPFKWICLTCNRCLRDEWGLEQHIQTVHGARTFACPTNNCN